MKAFCLPALLAAACAAAAVPLTASAAPPQYVEHRVPAGAAALPFSDAVAVGDTLYLAGHLGLDPGTGKAPADSGVEAHLVLDAVQHTLAAAGYRMDDLVSVTVYCTDLAHYEEFNAVYRGYFHGHYPARAFIGAGSLLRGARFEVQGVAVRSHAP